MRIIKKKKKKKLIFRICYAISETQPFLFAIQAELFALISRLLIGNYLQQGSWEDNTFIRSDLSEIW